MNLKYKITELPVPPEKYETNILERLDWNKICTTASFPESARKFINGLLRYYRPQNVLEVGVFAGAGSINILNAIMDLPNSTLTSIDLLENTYPKEGFEGGPVGFVAKEQYPNLPANKWTLIAGKDCSEVLDSLGKTYDFVVIDTAHSHPAETLNFLCVLPYLNEGAIVVLDDIALHFTRICSMATRILLSSVTAFRLELEVADYPSNVAAFQITHDTKKYIESVFDSLLLHWVIWPDEVSFAKLMDNVELHLDKHYPANLVDKFKRARKMGHALHYNGRKTVSPHSFFASLTVEKLRSIPSNTIFYGAGVLTKELLKAFDMLEYPFNFEIWDNNAALKEVSGMPVTRPNFEACAEEGRAVIITISDESILLDVGVKLDDLGYRVFHGLGSALRVFMNEPIFLF